MKGLRHGLVQGACYSSGSRVCQTCATTTRPCAEAAQLARAPEFLDLPLRLVPSLPGLAEGLSECPRHGTRASPPFCPPLGALPRQFPPLGPVWAQGGPLVLPRHGFPSAIWHQTCLSPKPVRILRGGTRPCTLRRVATVRRFRVALGEEGSPGGGVSGGRPAAAARNGCTSACW